MVQKGRKFTEIPRNFPSGTGSVLLVTIVNIVGKQAVQWVDGPDKTGSDDIGNENLGVKLGGDKSVTKRDSPQLDVQKLKLEQQPASQKLV